MTDETGVDTMFPGDPLEYPTADERDRADALLAECATRWGEPVITIARTHPQSAPNLLAGMPTNRAYLRSRLRRWWRRP